jgi:uncharacterized protein (TIGR02302 family)
MTDQGPDPETQAARAALARPLGWTRLGMGVERATRVFWPAWVIAGVGLTLWAFGSVGSGVHLGILGAGFALVVNWGLWRFRWPSRAEAAARLDLATPGRPVETLDDTLAIGDGDPAAQAVWRAHLGRIAALARKAKPVAPDLKLSSRDPFALRYVAATGVLLALVFGTWQGRTGDGGLGGPAQALSTGPAWEGWAEPPAYTGRPSLYLNELNASVAVPEGSRLTLRLYGPEDSLTVTQTVTDTAPAGSTDPVQELRVDRSGDLAIDGQGGRAWAIMMDADNAPEIVIDGPLSRVAGGEMRLPFTARDDFSVIGGTARIELDLAVVDRRYGLGPNPQAREDITFPIPLTLTGDRSEFTEVLAEDFSLHPWANLPVRISLSAEDDLGQIGLSLPFDMVLPGRRFFNPIASAIIEQRRDLLWTTTNGARVDMILRAITNLPEDTFTNETAYLLLTTSMQRLQGALDEGSLSPEARDEVAGLLWEAALQFEEGNLADAAERLRRAREMLNEAMRRGAAEDEISELMQELREALDDYMRQLAEQQRESGEPLAEADPNAQTMTEDQLQQMLDQIEELMQQGRMDEAQALLDQLMEMMENMQVAEGGEGQQGDSPGEQAMEDLQETLREQQDLADESFQDLQQGQQQGREQGEQSQQPGQQGQQGQEGQQGQQGQSGEGGQQQPGQGQPGQGDQPGQPSAESLAERQLALRGILENQRRNLPGAGTEAGDAARDALGRAGEAMDDAADALEQGALGDALDDQSRAIDALREGMKNLGEMMAQEQEGQQPGQGQARAGETPESERDPLGREAGNFGRLGTEDSLLGGEDQQRRAQDLLDEIRRRAGERTRPEAERDYLNRLLDRFGE